MNWSPPNAETHGFMPPVPKAITIKPIAARVLGEGERERERESEVNLQVSCSFCLHVDTSGITKGDGRDRHQDVPHGVDHRQAHDSPGD